jgi:dolichyl-phosphate-mannose-protein mannosyltransferase
MPNPEVAITVHTSPEEFEIVGYPTHPPPDWQASHRQEELPYYMTEETSARRRVTQHLQGPTPLQNPVWAGEYDEEGKDVYAKANAFQRYGSGGRVARRAPPPPPTSIVRLYAASSARTT